MGKDIITGLRGGLTERSDLTDDPNKTISIGKVTTNSSFSVNGWLGEQISRRTDQTDSVRFTLPYALHLDLNNQGLYTEISKLTDGFATLVYFDQSGINAPKSLDLTAGEYVLSVSDFSNQPIAYAISAQFSRFEPKDSLTGFRGGVTTRLDLSRDWDKAYSFGRATANRSFSVNGWLGHTDYKGVWDSCDRVKFSLSKSLHVDIDTDPHVITELVKFNNGVASVVSSVEYGDFLNVDLTPGDYGLSTFVEGDAIAYSLSATFT
jgi:hypothetical protein